MGFFFWTPRFWVPNPKFSLSRKKKPKISVSKKKTPQFLGGFISGHRTPIFSFLAYRVLTKKTKKFKMIDFFVFVNTMVFFVNILYICNRKKTPFTRIKKHVNKRKVCFFAIFFKYPFLEFSWSFREVTREGEKRGTVFSKIVSKNATKRC